MSQNVLLSARRKRAIQTRGRKSIIQIDLSDDETPGANSSQQETKMSSLKQSYDAFKSRIDHFELSDKINQSIFRRKSELELEKIKCLLDDWIFWTSRTGSTNETIDQDDIDLFKGYLLYLMTERADLEMLCTILRILKRLIEKNGSLEWTDQFKEITTSIQSEFYEKFSSTIKFSF
jgi:hypothetical protein